MTQDELRRKCDGEARVYVSMAQSEQGLSEPQECALAITEALLQKEMEIERLKQERDGRGGYREMIKGLNHHIGTLKSEIERLNGFLPTATDFDEQDEKIKSLQDQLKQKEKEIEKLENELRSPIRLSKKLLNPLTEEIKSLKECVESYAKEIERLEKDKHEYFDAVIEIRKQNEDLKNEIEYLKSSSLLAQEVNMKEDWRNKAVQHAEKVLLLQEQIKSLQEKLSVASSAFLKIVSGRYDSTPLVYKEVANQALKEIGE